MGIDSAPHNSAQQAMNLRKGQQGTPFTAREIGLNDPRFVCCANGKEKNDSDHLPNKVFGLQTRHVRDLDLLRPIRLRFTHSECP